MMGELTSGEALEAVQRAQEDPAALERMGEQLAHEAAELAAAECRWLLRLAEFDRLQGWGVPGARSCAHWLSWACGLSPAAARERVRVARALAGLPRVTAAFAVGELSYSKVRAVTRVATADTEEVLVTMARSSTAGQLDRVVAGYRRSAAAEEGQRAQGQAERQRVRWWYDDEGMLCLAARLPAEDGAQVVAALQAYQAQADARADTGADSGADAGADADAGAGAAQGASAEAPPEARTDRPVVTAPWDAAAPSEVAAARALVAMAEQAAAVSEPAVSLAGEELRHVVVHVDAALLADDGDGGGEVGELADGQLLARETIRRLACDGHTSVMVDGADASPLDVGRRQRTLTRRQRRALARRDGGCRFPGCGQRAYVDAHHVHHWADGGPTDLDNLLLLCRFHHRVVHEAGFTVALDAATTAHFARPDGTELAPSPVPPPTDAEAPVRGNRDADIAPAADALTPDWDGRPQDIDAAIEVLAWHADQPGPDPEPDPDSAPASAEAPAAIA